MSDRIDELVAAVRGGYPWQEYPAKSESYIALTELATITRKVIAQRDALLEGAPAALRRNNQHYKNNRDNWKARALKAEAMCEWLAGEVAMGRHDTVDNVLADARRAVTHER